MELIPSALPVLAAATVLAGGACLGATQSDDVDFERLFARSRRLGLVAEWLDISPTLAFWATVATLTMAPVLLWQWYPVVGVVAFVGLSLAFVFVERLLAPALATRTAARFEEQLPILADRLVSAVRGATPLLQALETVGPGLDPPLREAIVDLAAEATMGAGGLPEAVAAARDRHASRHFALILSVLSVFAERGGNLVEPMQRMSTAFKEIWRLEQKILTATRATRAGMRLVNLGVLAIVVIIAFTRPESFTEIFETPLGIAMFFGGMAIWAGGTWMMRELMKVDI